MGARIHPAAVLGARSGGVSGLSPNTEGDATSIDSDVSSRAICLNCTYSLAGLDPSGNCPECGAAIDESVRPGPFDFLDRRDANLLSIGVQCLLGAVGLGLAALLVFAVIFVSAGGWIGLAALGVPLGIASALVWLCGWHAIARVRALGNGHTESFARHMCTLVTWVQTAAFVPLLLSAVSLVSGRVLLSDELVLMTTVVSTSSMLVLGHWRLKSLAARTGDPPLNASGAFAAALIVLLLITTFVVLDGPLYGGQLVVRIGIESLTVVLAAMAWSSFLIRVCKGANLRAGPEPTAIHPESL